MSTLTKPQARIPLGWVTIAGQRMPVAVDLEWDRYLSVLTERAGGTTGLSTTDVDAGSYAAMQPASASDAAWPDIGQPPAGAGDAAGEPMQSGTTDATHPDVMQADLQAFTDILPMQA